MKKYRSFLTEDEIKNKIDIYKKEQNILAKAFVWLDLIRDELEDDLRPQDEIDAIEVAQKLIMTEITKFSIYL